MILLGILTTARQFQRECRELANNANKYKNKPSCSFVVKILSAYCRVAAETLRRGEGHQHAQSLRRDGDRRLLAA